MNNIENIINIDVISDLKKVSKDLNPKVMVGITGGFSQIKKDKYLNINLSNYLKVILIRSKNLIEASAA